MGKLEAGYARSILALGPPHSGKSVLSYLLFKYLRSNGNDAALFDCDIFSPTFRVHHIASEDELRHIYCPPNAQKLAEDVPLTVFEKVMEYTFLSVREKGIIVMDGLGKHSDKTQALLNRTQTIVIVCKDGCPEAELISCGYTRDGRGCLPSEFYSGAKPISFRVTTRIGVGESNVNYENRTAELYGLSRSGIVRGDIISIPNNTCEIVKGIMRLICDSNSGK
ncbi:MAG: hypothetical protein LYZ70_01605 [Nitrososphaerales archaeon]|nr:hypothetical protein [Nitrososphaerales archaeon]